MGKNPTHFNKISAIEGYYIGAKGHERMVVGMGLAEPGNQFFVDSSATGEATGLNWEDALTTLDAAFAKCTANNGDIIWVAPGHSETYSTTGTKVAADVAGVRVIGVGLGADRPTFTFSHTGATWSITAASVIMDNLLFVTGVDLVTAIATISGNDCIIGHLDGYGVEVRDTTDKEVIDAFIVTGDRFKANVYHHGYTGGDANQRTFKLSGVDDADIYVIALGKAQTAVVNFVSTACTNIMINGYFLVTDTTNLSKNVVATIGGNTWQVKGFDLGVGYEFSGGSGSAVTGMDFTATNTKVDSVGTLAGSCATTTNVTSVGTLAASCATTTNATSVGTLVTSVGTVAASTATTTNATSVGTLVTSVGTLAGSCATTVGTLVTSVGTLAGSCATTTNATSVGTLVGSVGTQLGTGLSNLGGNIARKTITYSGAVSYTAFTVAGCVAVKAIGYITTALTNHGDSTSVGTSTSAAGIIAATAGTSMQTVNQVWVDNAPSKFETYPSDYSVLGDGEDISVVGTANLTGGVVELYCLYIPLSADGTVVAA